MMLKFLTALSLLIAALDLAGCKHVATSSRLRGEEGKAASAANSGTFYVENGKLYDPDGKEFMLRGGNNLHIWYQKEAFHALDSIAQKGFNSVRIVWNTSGSAAELQKIVEKIIALKMVPIVELHDVTGNNDLEPLLKTVSYYTRSDIKSHLSSASSAMTTRKGKTILIVPSMRLS
jgi:hypothetical protein